MCCTISRHAKDILRLCENVRTEVRTQSIGGHKVDLPTENSFEQFGKIEQLVVALRARQEVDEYINITRARRGLTCKRAEDGESTDSKRTNLCRAFKDSTSSLGEVANAIAIALKTHAGSLSQRRFG